MKPIEIKALLAILNVDGEFHKAVHGELNYLRTTVYSNVCRKDLSIVITYHTGNASNIESAAVTSRFLNDWHPKCMALVGIATGYETSGVRIGDVIIPNRVLDGCIKVYRKGNYTPRSTEYARSDSINLTSR